MAEQLPLFVEPAEPNGNGHHDDLFEAVRALVAEPDMTDDEIRAVVEDALAQMGWTPDAPYRPKPCACEPGDQVLWGHLCWRCGRIPGPAAGPVYVRPVGPTPRSEKQL